MILSSLNRPKRANSSHLHYSTSLSVWMLSTFTTLLSDMWMEKEVNNITNKTKIMRVVANMHFPYRRMDLQLLGLLET